MRTCSIILLVLFLQILGTTPQLVTAQPIWWNTEWSYRQELQPLFPTNNTTARYQPVDLHIQFSEQCWAESHSIHSIRVIFQQHETLLELESQIYNLTYSASSLISSCNVVFLIPTEATGDEQYFVYYDDTEKAATTYPDHVHLEESSYRIEPIPGYTFESKFYQIREDNYLIYAIAKEGYFLGYTTAQHVTRLTPGTTQILPKNGEAFAAFDFRYYYGDELFDYSSTSQQLISTTPLIDGNLMLSCQIISTSDRKDIVTTAIYTYYYSPLPAKRISVHVKHEVKQTCYVSPEVETDGCYSLLQSGGIQSNSLDELNFGRILPYVHIASENVNIDSYSLDPDPEYNAKEPTIWVLNTMDDIDLGHAAWACFDEGQTGETHALIFDSTQVIQAGENEDDGIQIKTYEIDFPHLPGLEGNSASLLFCRNAYEPGELRDLEIPQGFTVEFNVLFFSSYAGYPAVASEAYYYQQWASLPSTSTENIDNDDSTIPEDTFDLTVRLLFARSFPLGSAVSVATGKNVSFITSELYLDNQFICSGTATRLPFQQTSVTSSNPVAQLISMIDWKNLSFFKKIRFSNLIAGEYTLRIFRQHTGLNNQKQFIGFASVNLQKNTDIVVRCHPEGTHQVHVSDQNNNPVSNASVRLLQDGLLVTEHLTDMEGNAVLTAPYLILQPYQLQISYHGLIVYENPVLLKLLHTRVHKDTIVIIDRFNYLLSIIDLWDLPPQIPLDPHLIPTSTTQSLLIKPKTSNHGIYEFNDLTETNYDLQIQYKSFILQKKVEIPKTTHDQIVFPATYSLTVHVLDKRGLKLSPTTIHLTRMGKNLELISNDSTCSFSVPPGEYLLTVNHNNQIVHHRPIAIYNERTIDLVTTHEPLLFLGTGIFIIVCIGMSLGITFFQKKLLQGLSFLFIGLLILSLVFPWWTLHSATSSDTISSVLYPLPLSLVTITDINHTLSGELSYIPPLLYQLMNLLILCLFSTVLLTFLYIFFHGRKKWIQLIPWVAVILTLGSIIVFTIALSMVTTIGVGSFVGSGQLNITAPGTNASHLVFCEWGPSIGYYLLIVAVLVLLPQIITDIKNRRKNQKNRLCK